MLYLFKWLFLFLLIKILVWVIIGIRVKLKLVGMICSKIVIRMFIWEKLLWFLWLRIFWLISKLKMIIIIILIVCLYWRWICCVNFLLVFMIIVLWFLFLFLLRWRIIFRCWRFLLWYRIGVGMFICSLIMNLVSIVCNCIFILKMR